MVFGAAQPMVPLLVLGLGGGATEIGLVLCAYSVSSVCSSRFWGKALDASTKRKQLIIVSFAITGLILPMFSLAKENWHITVVYAAMGFFSTAYIPTANMLIMERIPKREWTPSLSMYNFFSSIGWSLGLVIATIWLTVGSLWTLPWMLSSLSFVGAVFGVLTISPIEPHVPHSPRMQLAKRSWRTTPRSILVKPLQHFYLDATMILASFGVFYTALPAYLKGIGLSDGIVSLFFLMNSLVSTGTFLLLNGLSTRMADKRLIRLGIAAKLVGDFGFLVLSMTGVYVPNVWMAAVVLVSVGASWAVIWPPLSALLSKLADDRKLGDAQGKLSASGGLGGISGPLLAGYLFALAGYPCAFLGSGLIVIAGFLLFLKLR